MTPKPLLRRPEVEAITHLSRAAIYSKMKKGTFPLPVRLGSTSVAWRAEDIDRWISELPVANELAGSASRAAAADRALERTRERAAGHGVAQQPIDWPPLMPAVAEALLGEPSSATRRELRYGRKGSLSVRLDSGTWFDFEGGTGGGVLALVEREHGSRAAALAWLKTEGFIGQRDSALARPESRCKPRAGETGNPAGVRPYAAQPARREDSRRFARRVWTETRPLAGTVAERYLEACGVGHVAGAPALRFHPGLSHPNAPDRLPCLVAGVQDTGGRFLGIQRTYLAVDGSGKASVDPVRASLGSLAGGTVRLAESIDDRLLVGEGIESTAAAALILDWRGGAWAALGTSGLRAVELPAGVHDVVIAADRDAKGGGQLAAAALAERLEAEGRRVLIHFSHDFGEFGDFADALAEPMS